MAQHHALPVSPQKVDTDLGDPCDAAALAHAAEAAGLKAKPVTLEWADLLGMSDAFPAIARLKNGNFVVVVGVKKAEEGESLAVLDPLAKPANAVFLVAREAFCESWGGELILIKREYALLDENQPFGLRWFLPELAKQKGLLRDVAIAAMALHLLGLAVPVFVQLVIDKVVVHRGISTLYVLTGG